MKTYEETAGDASYLHAYQARATGPALQIAITGVIVMLLAGLLCAWAGAELRNGFFITALSGVISAGLHWAYLQKIWTIKLLEVGINYDIDGDGVIGVQEQPAKIEQEIIFNVKEDGSTITDRWRVHVAPDKLRALADGVLRGKSMTVREWSGAGKPVSQGEFEHLMDEMDTAKFVVRVGKGTRATWQPTPAGRAMLRANATKAPEGF